MIWKITCYNGTVWKCNTTVTLTECLVLFKRETGLSELDIKIVNNLH